MAVENVSKYYRLNSAAARRRALAAAESDRFHHSRGFAALRDVSFSAQPGDALAVVGANGAGKTTLLRVLANVVKPSEGRVSMVGRRCSLLGLRAGMNPRLTGRENVYLLGALTGFSKTKIMECLPSIIEFSELSAFLDQPLASYSPGMMSRLAFATAINLKTDILLLDEVLAVGDSSFQARALRRISEFFQSGSTVIFASHNLRAVESLCSKVLWLHEGKLREAGTATEVLANYRLFCSRQTLSSHPVASARTGADGDTYTLDTLDGLGNRRSRFAVDEEIRIRFCFEDFDPPSGSDLSLTVFDPVAGRPVFEIDGSSQSADGVGLTAAGELLCVIPPSYLRPRQYWAELALRTCDSASKSDDTLLARSPVLVFDPTERDWSEKRGPGEPTPKVTLTAKP